MNKPADTAASYGVRLKTVIDVASVSRSTLYGWHKSKPKTFEAVCRGVAVMVKQSKAWGDSVE